MGRPLADEVQGWLRRVAAAEHPPESVAAYNIGLFETGHGEYSAYLVGGKRYDPSDSSWACEEAFTPKERYLALPVGRSEDEWQLVLERVVEAVRAFLSSGDGRETFLAKARAVTVGFDDGDLVRVK